MNNANMKKLASGSNVINAVVMLGILGLMMLPVPPQLLDILLTFNITFALIILLVSIYIKEPLEFSVFPSLLLIVTLSRAYPVPGSGLFVMRRNPKRRYSRPAARSLGLVCR